MTDRAHSSPPPALVNTRVLCYATLQEEFRYFGTAQTKIGKAANSAVVSIAIGGFLGKSEASGVLLIHCTADWRVLGFEGCDSVAQAKERAEQRYPGRPIAWIEANVSDEQAFQHFDPSLSPGPCAFCGSHGTDGRRIIQKNSNYICENCVEQINEAMSADE